MSNKISMKTPLVNIVIATFNPRLDWFKEQLQSLNSQTYRNIIITIRDDCSDKVSLENITECIKENITNFCYSIHQNIENLGSTRTFEILTEQAEGDYIAYCDQDDIWISDKIEKLVSFIKQSDSLLVCSDVYIIDGNGTLISDSITKVRKRHIFKEGSSLASELLFKNFVIGCTMLMQTVIAKESIPFIDDMVHDHYLALYAATKGNIGVFKENLIKYRIHGNNQTTMLSNVSNKEEYYEVRIRPYLRRIEQLKQRFDIEKLDEAYEWAKAREGHFFRRKRSASILWKYRNVDEKTSAFELVMLKMPESIFKWVIVLLQNGKL
ncbi:glycosyltransferase [Aminipila sp.]|uniref:glycosyltransferase n=1 Tax=Aminipila sp. TaxID=2060095 RepID=UPI00289CB132|nr:glycosyltransferase [Aminipila sp.]